MQIIELQETTSVMDDAKRLIREGKLAPFDSVTAKIQTSGKGQYGRTWVSPEGNIYACMRLPLTEPFTGTKAASAFSTAVSAVLIRMGFDIRIKWMNDITVFEGKAAGILLEKFNGCLIAGIGINVETSPASSEMRVGAALPAVALKDVNPEALAGKDAATLWREIAEGVEAFSQSGELQKNWHALAERLLLWKNRTIAIESPEGRFEGVFEGIASDGALKLNDAGNRRLFYQGSIRPTDKD